MNRCTGASVLPLPVSRAVAQIEYILCNKVTIIKNWTGWLNG